MIGIDIGRVIISGDTDIPNQFFGEDYLKVPEVKGAFKTIEQIVEKYSSDKVYLVSKCGEIVQERTLEWLSYHDFFSKTGFNMDNIRFCRERHEKKEICKENNIRIFIDDRFSVLTHLKELEQLYLFDPSEDELKLFTKVNDRQNIRLVKGWDEIQNGLIAKDK